MNRSLGSSQAAAPRLMFNYLPVQVTADSFPACLVGYETADQLAQLRNGLSETHVVGHVGDQIACVPLAAEAPDVGKQEVLDTRRNFRLATRLVQASLVRTLAAWKGTVRSRVHMYWPEPLTSSEPPIDLSKMLSAKGVRC